MFDMSREKTEEDFFALDHAIDENIQQRQRHKLHLKFAKVSKLGKKIPQKAISVDCGKG